MGKNSGLRAENQTYPLEFVEFWQGGVVDEKIWYSDGTGTAISQVANGHMTCVVEGLNGSTATLGTLLGFHCAPSPNDFIFADNLNQGESFIRKLIVEFMAYVTVANNYTFEIGLNDVYTNALGGDALLFRADTIGAPFEGAVVRDTAAENTQALGAIVVSTANRFKIEVTRGRVSFFIANQESWRYAVVANLPNDFMYFWVRCITAGAGDQCSCRLYPIWIRYEFVK